MAKWRRRVAAGGAVSLFLGVLSAVPAAATASCQGHECDYNPVSYGCEVADGEAGPACCFGNMIQVGDTWMWESSEQENANWLPFGPNTTLFLHLSAWTDAQPESAFSVIQIAQGEGPRNPDPSINDPDATVNYWTNASGSDGQFTEAVPGLVVVENATCASWWARIVVAFDTPDGGGPLKHGPCWK